MTLWEWLSFIQTYFELCLLRSMARRGFTPPKLKNVLVAECRLQTLVGKKGDIEALITAFTTKRLNAGGRSITADCGS